MSNNLKYGFYIVFTALVIMFCTGTVIQTFLLESGFSEKQVYLYNALIQGVQVVVMVLSIFFSDLIRRMTRAVGFMTLAWFFLFFAMLFASGNREGNVAVSVTVVFSVSFIVYCVYGLNTVEGYRLPYAIMDMKSYGKVLGVSSAISGAVCFGVSLLYSFLITKFPYFSITTVFIVLAIVFCILAAVCCFVMKELPSANMRETKENRKFEIFKNKKMYLLLLPNFLRGITFGVVSLLAVIGISKGLLTTTSASYLNIALQVATFGGNICFALLSKKLSSGKMLLLSTVFVCLFLPLSILRGKTVDFIVGYLLVQFFMIIVNTSIPVIITEFIQYKQIGAFTAIRLAVYMLGSTVASLVLDWAIGVMGYLWLFIAASALQLVCGVGYYAVAKFEKNKTFYKKKIIKTKTEDRNLNKKFIKKAGLLFLSLAFVGCIGGVFAYKRLPVAADDADALLRTSYEFGETVNVPAAELEFNGQTVQSNGFVVYLPDGSAIKQSSFVIEDYGKYTVRYYASVSGRTVYADKTFTVQNTLCTSSNKGTTYTYGINEQYQTKKGLSLSIKAGDEIKINKLVDLSEATFATSFIDLQFTPVNYGIADAYRVYMKLTDAYDENNYVILRMQNWSDMGNWADGTCYIDAKAPNQEWTSSVEKIADHHKRGEEGKGWFGSYTSMTGRNAEGKRVYNVLKVFYDHANKRFNASGNYQGASMIVDLDDPEWYDLSKETLWKGFTTGECYVSFYGDRYNSSSLNLHITKLLGNDLSQSDADEDVPVITVDYAGEEPSALPYALLGNEYKIFSATAWDLMDGAVKTIANVYYDYDGNRCIVDSLNGVFRPTKEGKYTIVYAATDKSGNTAYKTVTVECKATAEKLSVTMQGAVKSCFAGETIQLFETLGVSGNNGKAEITISVLRNGKETTIDLNDPLFTPLEAGDYVVKVVAKDYVLKKEDSYTLEVKENPFPVFTKTAVMPRYFIKGATYALEGGEAVVYGSEVKEVAVQTFVSENKGAKKEISGRYTPAEAGEAEIIFQAKNGDNITPISVTVPIIDVGYCSDNFEIEAYFQDSTGKVTTNVTEDYIELCATSEGSIDFINAVQADSLQMTLNVNKNYQAFNRFYVMLTDSENESIQIKASYERAGDKITMYLNDNFDVIKTLPSNFNETSTSNILCNYTASTKNLYGFNDVWYTVEKDLRGNEFNGFPSKKVYLTIGFEDISGESRVKLMSINNQSLYDLSRDSARPQIIADSSIGSLRMGETITLAPAMYIDVLDPTVTCSMEVIDPNGNYVVALDGTKLDKTCDFMKAYEIKAKIYGDYSVIYSCKDNTNSRETLYTFTFSVKDFIAPEVTFLKPMTEAAKGTSVKIAGVSVSDNYSETVQTYFCVRNPKGTVTAVGDDKTFVADMVGVYTVFCYAFDEEGNSTFVSYEVNVK